MKSKNAYFTVEAALVFPVVISTIIFVIYILLFQYDRCLLEQDVGATALWGSRVEFTDAATLTTKTQERIAQINRDKYAAWEITALRAALERNCFTATGAGHVRIPVPGWSLWGGDNIWEVEAEYGYERLSPVLFVRLCRSVRQRQSEYTDGD